VPKLRDGQVEAIRALRVARSSAVKARSQATNQIKALIISGPPELRERLHHLPTRCWRFESARANFPFYGMPIPVYA
jgi:hypothetical protein